MPSYLARKMIVLLLTLPPTFWPARAPARWKKWVRQFKFMAHIYINAHTYAFAFTFQLRRSHCLWKHFFSIKLYFLVEKRLRSKTQNNNKTNDNDDDDKNTTSTKLEVYYFVNRRRVFVLDLTEKARERERRRLEFEACVTHTNNDALFWKTF